MTREQRDEKSGEWTQMEDKDSGQRTTAVMLAALWRALWI